MASDHRGNGAPTVSVIVPAYNVAPYIGETLHSVLAQSFRDYEVIVVNDGSPDSDELERVLEPYRHAITYITQENRGLSGARNSGIRAARAPLLAFLDSDDLWEPEYLAVQVAAMNADPRIDVRYVDARFFGGVGDARQTFMQRHPSEGPVTLEALISQRCHVMVSVIGRRDTIVKAGMFDESLRAVEDFDLWLRIVRDGGCITYGREVLVRYRERPGSLSSNTPLMARSVMAVFDKVERTFELSHGEHAALAEARRKFRALLALYEGKKALSAGDYGSARDKLTEAHARFRQRKLALVLWSLRHTPRLVGALYRLRARWHPRRYGHEA